MQRCLSFAPGGGPDFPVGGFVAVIRLSVALLFPLSTPWCGSITVSGQPIDAVVRDLHTGYFQH